MKRIQKMVTKISHQIFTLALQALFKPHTLHGTWPTASCGEMSVTCTTCIKEEQEDALHWIHVCTIKYVQKTSKKPQK